MHQNKKNNAQNPQAYNNSHRRVLIFLWPHHIINKVHLTQRHVSCIRCSVLKKKHNNSVQFTLLLDKCLRRTVIHTYPNPTVDQIQVSPNPSGRYLSSPIRVKVIHILTQKGIMLTIINDNDVMYRSEEHTSELQSHVRISYAVFCLKKKKINKKNTHRCNDK